MISLPESLRSLARIIATAALGMALQAPPALADSCDLDATAGCMAMLSKGHYVEILNRIGAIESTVETNNEQSIAALFYVGASHYYLFQSEPRLTIRCRYAEQATEYLGSFQRAFARFSKGTATVGAATRNLLAYSLILRKQLESDRRCVGPGFSPSELASLTAAESERQVDAFFLDDQLRSRTFSPANDAVRNVLTTSSQILDTVRDHKLKLDSIEQELDKRPGMEGMTYKNLLEFAIGTSASRIDELRTRNGERERDMDAFGRIQAFESLESNIVQVKGRAAELERIRVPMEAFFQRLFGVNPEFAAWQREAAAKQADITEATGQTGQRFNALKGHLVGNPNPAFAFFKNACSGTKKAFYCQ